MTPIISIIVPVYKVEPYLRHCVDSILSQTVRNIEIILVDDGSPDNCGMICDDYATKDSRVKVIHQANAGVSSARNAGLDEAEGEWICFIDGDDWVDLDYLQNFSFEDEAADLFIQGYKELSIEGELIKIHSFSTSGYLNPERLLIEAEQENIINSPCFKLFKKSIIIDNHIRFEKSISYGEDHIFSYEYLLKVNSIRQSLGVGYNVNRGIEGSLSTKVIPFEQLVYFTEKLYALQLALLDRFTGSSKDLMSVFNQRRYLLVRKMLSDSRSNGLNKRELSIIKSIIGNTKGLDTDSIGFKHYFFMCFVKDLPYCIVRIIV